MMADSRNIDAATGSFPGHPRADVWHLWTVWIPRRSIAGRLVWGMVWRRSNGRRWVYKKFIEYSEIDGGSR